MSKVILITGASAGIGAAIARKAAQQNYAICINYRSNDAAAARIKNEAKTLGAEVICIKADVSQESDVEHLFNELDKNLGTLDALVNNAGIITPISNFDTINTERLHQVFSTNVYGSFFCAREAVKRMSTLHEGHGGAIVNLSSIAASLGSPNEFIDYAATKGAIDTMTKGLAKEVADQGIRVNAVRPGLIETDMHAHAGDADRPQRLQNGVPIKRPGSSDEIASAVMWLLSDEASYVTGSLLDVSGGR